MNIPNEILDVITESCSIRGVDMDNIEETDPSYTFITKNGILKQMEALRDSGKKVGLVFVAHCTPTTYEIKSHAVEV